jgi:hypothetical protein
VAEAVADVLVAVVGTRLLVALAAQVACLCLIMVSRGKAMASNLAHQSTPLHLLVQPQHPHHVRAVSVSAVQSVQLQHRREQAMDAS